MTDAAPLILALTLDDATQQRLDGLRRAHFPPERNLLSAHVTAFHALPGEHLDELVADLRETAPDASIAVAVTGVRSLGRGVAFDLSAPEAESLRAGLARRWAGRLTAQDSQRWRPHVTVQNKVTPEAARALHRQLAATFVPYDAEAVGWGLFRYRGGPWEHVLGVPFA
ncbi:2'-5' RNA ligase family protein [Cellulomonas aerilata]|uniref:Uncharacterized protein n=1 Tax=Cellulomonas aerilata TaxID=515326 RepID=A0A512DAV4_9CELL|nr:2'-5' RNA ligase family protein [Cellulomonas aerilata]GEO33612.1 hypothetical protein CAE01nite_13370 [Cellulomonas aerilata]